MFGIDICAMIISFYSLKYFCKTNLIKCLYDLMEKYWWIMAIKLSLRIAIFFCYNDINGAMDYTLKFEWISENGRFNCSIMHRNTKNALYTFILILQMI